MILLTGALGYVGAIIRRHFEKHHELLCVDRRPIARSGGIECDLADGDAVRDLARRIRPIAVVHAAGNKDIAFCEKNPPEAHRINCETTRNIAAAFGERSRIIYISTDYVFEGIRGNYEETDRPNPSTVYGKSKWCGETEGKRLAKENFTILRTSAIYDLAATFPRFLREKLSAGEAIDCYTDIVYSPTYYKDFLRGLERIIEGVSRDAEIFHICGESTTRYAFARAFAETFGFDPGLVRPECGRTKGMFLFPDLSMNNDRTRSLLGTKKTSIIEALGEMRRETAHAGY
jgi:dTDP-4-dehydrorhamnose reductase